MKRLSLPLALAALVVPALAQEEAPQTPPADQAEDAAPAQPRSAVLGFRWGPGGTVPVRETHTTGGQEIVSTYTLGWKKDGQAMLLGRSSAEYLTLGGQPIPADAPQLTQRRVHDMLTPGIRLNPAGRFTGFASLKAVEVQLNKLEEEGQAELVGAVREGQKNKVLTTATRQSIRDAWEIWAGAWAGTTLAEGQSVDFERQQYPGVGMKRLPAKVHAECIESLERGGVRCIRVKMTVQHEGDEFAGVIEKTLAGMPGAEQLQRVGAMKSRTLALEGVFETGTGRPHQVSGTTMTVFDNGQGEPVQLEEKRAFAFDWSQAKLTGAGKAGAAGGKNAGGGAGNKKPQGGAKKPGQKKKGQGGQKKKNQGGGKKKQQEGGGR
ncbi:MAG: hypothetical protein AAF682_06085 [Planctomycetota bacterium]